MNKKEITEATEYLVGIYPNSQVTDEIADLFRKDFKPFTIELTREAIDRHKRQNEFLNYPALLYEIRSAHKARASAFAAAIQNESWCDFHRRTKPELADRSDFEVILRIHWRLFVQASRRESYRKSIESRCRMLLEQFGMEYAAASTWAATVFGDENYFREVLAELRAHSPQRTT